jgi:hypothetical protein
MNRQVGRRIAFVLIVFSIISCRALQSPSTNVTPNTDLVATGVAETRVALDSTAAAQPQATLTFTAQPTRPKDTSTPAPTPTLSASPTSPALSAAPGATASPATDEFTLQPSGNPTTNQFGTLIWSSSGDKILAEASTKKGISGWISTGGTRSDFTLQADAQHLSGAEYTYYGLMFANNKDGSETTHYVFEINDQGGYFVNLLNQGQWMDPAIKSYTKSSAIRPGKVNQLRVTCQEGFFTFYINDRWVFQFTDPKYTPGSAGLIVELPRGGDQAKFEFSNFDFSAP